MAGAELAKGLELQEERDVVRGGALELDRAGRLVVVGEYLENKWEGEVGES